MISKKTPKERRIILKHADDPKYSNRIGCYLRKGGYAMLKKSFKMILNFNGKEDVIENCSISYLIPYVNSSLGSLSLFKVGLSFKKIEGLRQHCNSC